jgi:hypothetical protein
MVACQSSKLKDLVGSIPITCTEVRLQGVLITVIAGTPEPWSANINCSDKRVTSRRLLT